MVLTLHPMSSISVDRILEAYLERTPAPQGLANDLESAYALQRRFVEARMSDDAIGGFKAGMTNAAAQKNFGLDDAVVAVLFESGALASGADLDLSTLRGLVVETEVGYVLGADVNAPVQADEDLPALLAAIEPVIELPCPSFAERASGLDFVANNIVARHHIPGEASPPTIDPNEITVSLSRDGEVINQGKGSDAMGDQWSALRWLINEVLARGYTPRAGHLLITGSLGPMLPAEPGHYVADYGPLGTLEFTIS